MQRLFKSMGTWLIVLIIFYSAYAILGPAFGNVTEISYSELVKEVKAGNVVYMEANSEIAELELSDGSKCRVKLPSREVMHSDLTPELENMMAEGKLYYDVKP